MKKEILIFLMLFAGFFLIACSSPPVMPPVAPPLSPPATPPTFVHVVPKYQEVIAEQNEIPALTIEQQPSPTHYLPPTTHGLPDAGMTCTETYDCKGFCLALERNATLGFCSDTRTPPGCAEYLLRRNVTTTICN